MTASVDPAQLLNRDCLCVTVDRERLAQALARQPGAGCLTAPDPHGLADLLATHPHLFADSSVYVGGRDLARMAGLIAAVERVVATPAWQAQALARHGLPAAAPAAARGVFFGYDFHLGANGPQLIEINTNAGGALLNIALRQAQIACCEEALGAPLDFVDGAALVAMFRAEWQLARGEAPLRTVAIVDRDPPGQYLLPEFERFADLFAAHGIEALILDPAALAVRDGALMAGERRIDLVYNRLTDFLLTEPANAALAAAWQHDLAVITPHPRAWALYADKHNLITLTDPVALRALGIDEATIAELQAGIPRTVAVTAANAEALWAGRKHWFFKPVAGYGGKAAYRGDKLTRGKWQEILAGSADAAQQQAHIVQEYVAQEIVPPSERRLQVHGDPQVMKLDLRNYVYDGRVQLVSARLYQGQTTNFRTEGGGFAAVFAV